MNDTANNQKLNKPTGTLGTFAGVFIPSVLTILGIILFLRLGYVTGSAGIGRAFLIILLANTISVLTSMSLSAIATNIKVKGGGDYFLISRTLGLQFGGAIGMVYWFCRSRHRPLPAIFVFNHQNRLNLCCIISFYFCMAGRRLGDTVSVCRYGTFNCGLGILLLGRSSKVGIFSIYGQLDSTR